MRITMAELIAQQQQELLTREQFPETDIPSPDWNPKPWTAALDGAIYTITPDPEGGAWIEGGDIEGKIRLEEWSGVDFLDTIGLRGKDLVDILETPGIFDAIQRGTGSPYKPTDLAYYDNTEYTYSITYDIVTEESAQHGDVAESGYEVQDQAITGLEDLLRSDVDEHTWLEWSSSFPQSGDWLTSDGEQDMRTGNYTTYALHIKHADGSNLSLDEMKLISRKFQLIGISRIGK